MMVAMEGRDRGTAMRNRHPHSPQPSMYAASKRDLLIPRKNERRIIRLKGLISAGTTSAHTVLISFRFFTSR